MASTAPYAGFLEPIDLLPSIQPLLAGVPSFLLDLYFGGTPKLSESNFIAFEEIFEEMEIADYVLPDVEVEYNGGVDREVKIFKPAYSQDAYRISARDLRERQPDESPAEPWSMEQRRVSLVADRQAKQLRKFKRLWEAMAAETLITGKLTVKNKQHEKRVVDYKRDAANSIVITDNAKKWGQAGVSPYADMGRWMDTFNVSMGVGVGVVVMDPIAATRWKADTSLDRILDRTRGQEPVVNLGYQQGAPGTPVLLGSIDGVDYYQYQARLKDSAGNYRQLLPDASVLIGSPAAYEGRRCFGAIEHMRALAAMEVFQETVLEGNGKAEVVHGETSPLMVPGRPNATMVIKVA